MQRSIDAPDQVYSTADQAAAWLGLTTKTFRAEARLYPHLLPATTIGRGPKYHWLDLVCYAHLRRQGAVQTADKEEENAT